VIIYRFIKSDFNEIVDGLVYIAAIALGFSIIENIFYSFSASDPFGVLFQRSIFSVLGHISFSGFLGLAYFIHVRIKRNFLGIVLSILLASLAHGLYDTVLFERGFNIFFRPLFIGIIIFQFLLVKIVLGFSTFRKELSIDLFESYDRTVFLKCSKCKSSIKDKGIRFWKINGVICNSCNNLVLQGDNVASLFKYFRPALRIQRYFKDLAKNKKIQYLDNDERVSYNWQRTILSSSIPDLSEWLKSENEIDRKKILKIPIIGPLIWYLGIRLISNE
jgi:hypothetical protein